MKKFKKLAKRGPDRPYIFEDMLEEFFFHHLDVKSNRVAIRMGIKGAYSASAGHLDDIGIYLSAPKSLKKAVEAANKQENGFMINNLPEALEDYEISFSEEMTLNKNP